MHMDPYQYEVPGAVWMEKTQGQQDDLASPAFFATQCGNLNALLDTVVRESASATDPDACIDFLQLTEIISSLLEEAQMYSIMSTTQLTHRKSEVCSFMGKIETVHSAISDWNVRTAPPPAKGKSRKRARTASSNEHETRANRRRMELETEQALNMAPVFDGPYSEMLPLNDYIERDQSAWWSEPFYD